MASLTYESKARRGWRLRTYDPVDSRRRHSIWLGEMPQREAEKIRLHVESIVDAQRHGSALRPESERWLRDLHTPIRRKLDAIFTVRALTLHAAMEKHIAALETAKDRKENTIRSRRTVARKLRGTRIGNTLLTSVSGRDIDNWLGDLNIAESTRGTYASTLRGFYKWAVEQRLCGAIMLQTPSGTRVGDKTYLTTERMQDMINVFRDDAQLQCLVALIRWCGLRVPSEIVELPRSACDWQLMRLTFIDHKRTYAKSRAPPRQRQCPIFPEVAPYLERIWKIDAPPTAPLLPDLVSVSGGALAKRIRRRIERAGDVWDDLFRSIRATRETELIARFPVEVASKWIGNSPVVASKVYHLISDEQWKEASTCPTLSTSRTP